MEEREARYGEIRVICSRCKKVLGYKDAEGGKGGDSHTFCPACAGEYLKKQKEIIARMKGGILS